MDRGAQWDAVYGVTQIQTQLGTYAPTPQMLQSPQGSLSPLACM